MSDDGHQRKRDLWGRLLGGPKGSSEGEPVEVGEGLSFREAVAQGIAHRNAGEFEQALPCWERAWKVNPNDLRSAINVVQMRRKTGLIDDLAAFIDDMIINFPERAEPYREMGKFLYYDDEVASLPYWEKAFHLAPDHMGSRILLIKLFIRLGQYEKAWPIVEEGYRQAPENDELLVLQVQALIYRRAYETAGALLQEAMKANPGNAILMTAYGKYLINFLRDCQQEVTPEGASVPIALAKRERFLRYPAEALAPWNKHPAKAVADRLRSETAAEKKAVPARPRQGRTRLLFVSDLNWNFMRGIVEYFDNDPAFEVRTLEFKDIPRESRVTYFDLVGHLVAEQEEGRRYRPEFPEDAYFMQQIDWADVIHIEWCNYPALWLSWFAPKDKKIVLRMHSYEAFVWFPHWVNWGNIDVLVNVAGHIQNLLCAQIDPTDWGVTRLEVLPNHNDLEVYQRPRPSSARKTLGMAGYNTANKNPAMALDILRRLRETDDSWTLRLIGHAWPDEVDLGPEEREHQRRFDELMSLHGMADAVTLVPYNQKLEEEMSQLSYILSCSDREGTHETVLQGMAAGCVPVIRKWPLTEPWINGSRTYAEAWWVSDAAEAAARIRGIEAEGKWETLSELARKEVMEQFDCNVVMPAYRSLLLA